MLSDTEAVTTTAFMSGQLNEGLLPRRQAENLIGVTRFLLSLCFFCVPSSSL